jgi:hypothetical protein
LHKLATSFVLGYHGCDRDVAEKLIAGEPFEPSDNDYDWLGHGIYFWESNPLRGYEFAAELKSKRQRIDRPYVVGAAIDLGYCLDLLSTSGIQAVQAGYDSFCQVVAASGAKLPVNAGGHDLLLRKLDCAVVNHIHGSMKQGGLQAFDTVRGVFLEGDRLYENSGFYRKTHIQICVCNPLCIKGVFRLPREQLSEFGID